MFTVNGRICGRLAEIIPEQLYFCSFYDRPKSDASTSYYYVDDDVHYDSFYSDFGPLNLSVLYRFCVKLDEKLKVTLYLLELLVDTKVDLSRIVSDRGEELIMRWDFESRWT